MRQAGIDFEKIVLGTLKILGWRKRRKNAFYQSGEILIVVNLQKCSWDDTISINLGFLFLSLQDVEIPKYTDCHLQYEVEDFIEGFPEWIDPDGGGGYKTKEELEEMEAMVRSEGT